jgi:exopolysaccharide biosynthesis polyprenyl glycosylphosphotransferase
VQAEGALERVVVPPNDPLNSLARLLPRPQGLPTEKNLATWVVSDIATVLLASSVGLLCARSPLAPWLWPLAIGTFDALWGSVGYVLLQGVLITLIGYSEGAYRTDLPVRGEGTADRLAKSVFWATALVALAARTEAFPLLLISGALGFAGMVASRYYRRRSAEKETSTAKSHNVLIVGAGQEARALASHLGANPQTGRIVVGFLDDYWPVGAEVLGRTADLAYVARAHFVDEVIVALDNPQATRAAVRTAVACRLDVGVVPYLADCGMARNIAQIGRWPLITVHEERPPAIALIVKRGVDILGAIAGLLLTSPLLVLIAVRIKLDSRGPVLYAAPRAGRKGARFRCYKFRTMTVDADVRKQQLRSQNQRQGPFFKIEHDPRVTRCGRWLRKYSLDELPQLWNVLRGDMSLVGPRPHPLDDFAGYQLVDLCRLDVRPGLTGLWQTTARRDPSFQTSMRLDKEYIERWNLALDFRILLRTLRVVVSGGGC